jgi:hypothetical protein
MTMLEHFDGLIRSLFVETGTNEGNTLAHASLRFEHCISIEQNEKLYLAAVERFKFKPNVRVYKGHSPLILPKVLDPAIETTFWLDAHYSANGNTMEVHGECPLMDELAVIVGLNWKVPPIILIDDAFMFDDSVFAPDTEDCFWKSNKTDHIVYHRNQWPRVEEIDAVLTGYKRSMLANEFALRYDWRGA